eukprot:Partr_v1_DN25212_c0_g1_i1_m16975 putative adaptor-related protein complex 3, mu
MDGVVIARLMSGSGVAGYGVVGGGNGSGSSVLVEKWWRPPPSKVQNVVERGEVVDGVVSIRRRSMAIHAFHSGPFAVVRVVETLHLLADVILAICGEDTFDRAVVARVLTEMFDYGGRIVCGEVNCLRMLVDKPSTSPIDRVFTGGGVLLSSSSSSGDGVPQNVASLTPWRPVDNIRYARNEICIDVMEEVNATIDHRGRLVCAEVVGEIWCNCRLSACPQVTIACAGVGGRVLPTGGIQYSLHPCVNKKRFAQESILALTPPDGLSKLVDYSVAIASLDSLPVTLRHQYTRDGDHLFIQLAVKCGRSSRVDGVTVRHKLPLHGDVVSAASSGLTCNHGSFTLQDRQSVLVWKCGDMQADSVAILSGSIRCDDLQQQQPPLINRHPISVEFSLPSAQKSNYGSFDVTKLKILNESYAAFKGIRRQARSGLYQFRT